MEIKTILRVAKSQLSESGISEVDAEHLLAHVMGMSRMDLHNPVLLAATLLGLADQDVLEEQFFALLDSTTHDEDVRADQLLRIAQRQLGGRRF